MGPFPVGTQVEQSWFLQTKETFRYYRQLELTCDTLGPEGASVLAPQFHPSVEGKVKALSQPVLENQSRIVDGRRVLLESGEHANGKLRALADLVECGLERPLLSGQCRDRRLQCRVRGFQILAGSLLPR